MLDRRTILAGAAAVAALPPWPARAATAVHTIGSMSVRVFSDGYMPVGLDRFGDRPAGDADLKAALGSLDQLRFAVNVTLIEAAGRRILVDAGAGGTWVDTAGKLSDTLSGAAIDPATINHVVLTHGHPDHLWGVIDDFDNSLRFPQATYTLPKAEFDFWMTAGRAAAAGAGDGVIAGARRVLKAIEAKLTLVAADREIMPGLTYLDANGHTPGQCAVLVSSGGAHALIAADTIFHPVASVQHPHWRPAQDMDGDAAVKTRLRMLDLAAARSALVLAYHVEGPGRIARAGAGFKWQPA